MAFPTTDLVARFEARLESGYSDNDPITTAINHAGTSQYPNVSGGSPTFKTGILNGEPVFRFDGTDDHLSGTASSDNFAAFTICAVLSSGAAEATSRVWPFTFDSSSTTRILALTEGVTSGEWGTFVRTSGTGGGTTQQSTSAVDTREFCVLVLVWDGTNATFYRDGAQVAQTSRTGLAQSMSRVQLGANLSEFFSGDLALAAGWSVALGSTALDDLHDYVETTYFGATGPPWTLTVDVTGSGTVTKDPDEADYDDLDEVELTAVPDSGWAFDSWSGDLTGDTNPDTIVMDADKTVGALFVAVPPSDLTVNPHGSALRAEWVSGHPEHVLQRERWVGEGDPI